MNQRFVYRNPRILAHANGQACQNCGAQDGTVGAAHSNAMEHGRGSHHKARDIFIAYLCHACHYWLDFGNGIDPSGLYRSDKKREMFCKAMHKTLLILVRDGILK